MATERDALIVQAAFALAQGAAGSHISSEACAWFHERYHRWIGLDSGSGTTPAQVWGSRQGAFLERFKEIGKRAREASQGAEIRREILEDCARKVESESICPHCPKQ